MPTQKRRLNISLPQDIDRALVTIAQRDNVPQATKAIELLEHALEIEEDVIWDSIAKKRDTKKTKFLSHSNAWS